MKSQERQSQKTAKEALIHFDVSEAARERTLKANAKLAANQKLYLDGYRKGLLGVPLESFTDLVEENGKMIQRKDHRNFKAGYLQGCKELASKVEENNNHMTR